MHKEDEKLHSTLEDKIAELELQGIKVEEVDTSDDVPTGWRRGNHGLKRSTVFEDDRAILYQVAPFGGTEKETTYYVWRHGELEPPRDKERYITIKKKLFNAVNEVLKPHGFKRHRTKRSTWWRKRGDTIQAINFQKSLSSREFVVNLGIHKASRIEDVDGNNLEQGERMDILFIDKEGDSINYDGRVKINELLNFESITDEDAQIAEFNRILDGFIPLCFDIPSDIEVNRKKILRLLEA